MTVATTNMSLLKGQGTDNARDYLKTHLAGSLDKVDAHDHTTGKGVQVPTAGIEDDAVTTDKILDANVTAAKLASGAAATNVGTGGVTAAMLAADAKPGAKKLALQGGDAALGTNEADLTNLTYTIPTTGVYFVLGNFKVMVSGAGDIGGLAYLYLYANGSKVTESGMAQMATVALTTDGDTQAASAAWVVSVTAGQVVKLRAQKVAGTGSASGSSAIAANGTNMIVLGPLPGGALS